MSKERVSIYKAAKLREKKKAPERASAYLATKQNRGSDVGYVAKRAGIDFLRVGEGVVDAAAAPVDLITGNVDRAKSRFMDSPVDAMRERLDEEYNPGKVAGFIGDIAGGIGQSVGYGLISAIPYAGKPMMYSSIVEQGISSAAEQTGKVGLKEIGYGATVGAIEGTLESKLGAGVNAFKSIGSAILKKTGLNVAESAAKAGGKSMLKSVLTDTAKGFAGEFAEEAISEAVDPALLRLYNIDENAQFSLKDVAYAGLIGGLSGGIMSAGPAAINYRSAVSVGRAIQESRLDGELIKRARYTLSALEAAQTRSTGQIKGKSLTAEGDTKETAKERLSRTSENRRVKRLSKETAQLADKIRRNIAAYENSMKDPAMAQSEPVAAILGELRGNLFLVGYAYEADVIEQVMMEADDKQRQAFVDAINEELAAQGKKHDYTLADFDANKDDIRRGLAGRLMMDELRGNTAEGGIEYGAEATEKPAEAATSPWDGMADNEDMSGYKAAGEAENALLRAAVNQSVPRGSVQAMLDEYRKGTDLTPEEFAAGWSDGAHIYGRYGLNVDEASPLSRMSPEAREAAMKFGRETEEAERKAAEEKAKAKKKPAAQAGKKGTVVRGEGLNIQKLSNEQYAAYKAAEVLAEVLGTDIVIETKILTNKGKEANGFYKRGDNTIHININALRNGKNVALYTLGHEITHYIKEWSPQKFEALADFVLDQMGVDAETAIADKLASLKRLGVVKDTMTVAEANAMAREELVAEGMELVLTDGKVLEELAKTDKTLWEKIRDWFFDIIGQIRRSWQDLNQASKTAQVLKETVESLEEIERLFTEGVREAGERTRTAGVETETQTDGEKVYSFTPADFEKPITLHDIEVLRSIGRKSINAFTSEDIEKAQKWAYKYFKDLSVKSPFFRAWFGEWRAHQKDSVTVVPIPTTAEEKQRSLDGVICKDTVGETSSGWKIRISGHGERNTRAHAGSERKSIQGLTNIKGLIENAILLDTEVHEHHDNNAVNDYIAFDHKLYALGTQEDGRIALYKITVEEMWQSKSNTNDLRFHNLKYIEKVADNIGGPEGSYEKIQPVTAGMKSATEYSIADLYGFVKRFDEEFTPAHKVSEVVLNEDGTPKVFYHGTDAEWTAYDLSKNVNQKYGEGIYLTPDPNRARLYGDRVIPLYVKATTDFREAKKTGRPRDYTFVKATGDIVVVSPEQIKSATDNIGTFDGENPDIRYSIDEDPDTAYLAAEDQNLLFDADFYERYENESREPITETVEELEAVKASEAFAAMSDDEAFDLNAKLKAKRAGYNTVYDYYVETEKERMGEEYRRYVQTGRSNRTSRTLEEKRKKAQKERTLRSDVDSATPLQNAQYQIIQETNPMWDEYHTGIRSPKEIKTFAEVAEDTDSFTWGDFTREDARKALRDGTVRVYSSYAIKNGVFVSTSYKQALGYAGNDPAHVHSRVVALDSVAWINGDEGQYAKVYKDDGIRYSIDETPETPDVSDSAATDRDMLLAMAERLVGSEEENKILTNYKSHYDTQKARQARLDELAAEMREQQSIMMYDQSADKRSAAAKRLPTIYKEMGKISEQLADADRKLTEIEGMKAIRNLLKREAVKAREIQKNIYDTRAKVKREAAETTELRRKTRRIYNRVLRLLVSPNRKRNIPYELQGIAAEALKTANMDLEALERLEKLEQELTALEREAVPNPEKIAKKEEQIEAQEKKVGKTKDHTKVMIEIFEKAKDIKEGVGRSVYDESALAKLKDLQSKIGNTTIGRMNREQLQALKDFYDILYTRISNANKMLSEEREATVEEYGSKATTEAHDAKSLKFLSPKAMELKGMANIRQFFWKNMKPLTVFEAIGSDTFTRLFQSVLNGENVWARDIEEARKKIVETRDKYGYDKWELDKRVEVKDKDGKTVRLSLSEMMSLYAYAKRKQAMGHLEGGGFVLDPNATEMAKGKTLSVIELERRLNHSERHVVDQLIIGEIASKLTAEQKAYVDEMQTYLTKLGERGNTVSRKLYGIDIFTEEFYFPIKVGSEYLESHTGKTGDPNIKNRGMTKEVTPDADNPLVLQGFDAVMVDHINSMATYHAFVLPVEDLTRVLNYKPSNAKIDEDGNWTVDESRKDYSTLKAVIEEKYGAEANHYIEQLIRDLNGGARRDAAATLLDKGITGFKRASTMASLSVLFQQPTSLIRAAAYIDPKYLFGQASIVDFANHKKLWERLCKYAPVGIIKEMGGYDTGVGARTGDYLNAKVYKTPKEKWEAFFKPERFGGDSNYRAEVFGKGAAYADEMAWIQMFEACVSEQADKLGKSRDSEDVLKAAGKRFEEVVRRTQVYDSTLTRTEYMRSKDTGMKMATAFMAEPSTIVSMVADAIMKAERGDTAFLRRTATAVAGAVILNALVSSLIYAMRDDDEEKTYGEKYVASVAMEAAEAINPLEYLPYFRDIMSIMKGYEIERTDMTLISNLFQQVELLTSSKRTVGEKMLGVSGAVSAFFGIPVTNLTRDAKGIVNTVMGGVDTERGTAKGMSAALKEEFSGILGLFDEQTKNEYQLYQAYVSGDTAHYNRVKARYKSDQAAEMALRQALRDNDPRISEAAEARLSGDLAVYESLVDQIEAEGIFDRNIVIRAVNNEVSELKRAAEKGELVPKDETATDDEETAESLYKSSDLNAALERGDAEDFAAILAALVEDKVSTGKTEAQAKASVKSAITSYWKKQYLSGYRDTETRKRIIKLLTDTGLYGSRNDVAIMCESWVKASASK